MNAYLCLSEQSSESMAYKSPNKPSPACSIPVVCIDDSNRPSDVPVSKWPVKGGHYTITGFYDMIPQGGVQGVSLAEMDISDCHPYRYYLASRFVPTQALMSLSKEAERLMQEDVEECERELELEEA